MTETQMRPLPRIDAPKELGSPGAPGTFHWIPLDQIQVDDTFQRAAHGKQSQALIRRIARAFTWSRFGTVDLDQIGPDLYSINDGQHRCAAALCRGDIVAVPAMVYTRAHQDQAADFVGKNTHRRGHDKAQLFHASVAAGEEEARALAALLEAAGIQVQRDPHPNGVQPLHTRAITALQKLRKNPGEGPLLDALMMMAEAWPEERDCFGGPSVTAVTLVCNAITVAEMDLDRLARKLEALSLPDIQERARVDRDRYGRGKLAEHMAEILLADYNKGLRERLATKFV